MKADRITVSNEMKIDRFQDQRFNYMNNTQESFETLPVEISTTVLSNSFAVLTDIQHHIQAVCELVNEFLSHVENLPTASGDNDETPFLNLRDEVRRFEIDQIQRALTRTGGSQVHAAKLLGLNPTTLNAKIKRYRLQPPYIVTSGLAQFVRPNSASREGV